MLGSIAVDTALEEFVGIELQEAGVRDFVEGDDMLLGVDPDPPDSLFFSSWHDTEPPFVEAGSILCDFGIKSNMQFSHKLK